MTIWEVEEWVRPSSRDGQAPAGKTEGRSGVTGVQMAGRDGRRFPQHPTLSTLTSNQHSLKILRLLGLVLPHTGPPQVCHANYRLLRATTG